MREHSKSDTILDLLTEAEGFVSGQKIADALGVTRTVVWEEIRRLESLGYRVESMTRRGYRLLESPDTVREPELRRILREVFGAGIGEPELRYFGETESTNLAAKKEIYRALADGTAEEPVVFFYAQRQSGGRGRLGRSWFSPRYGGIYMSILLHPNIPPHAVQLLTILTGAAICRALRRTTGLDAVIKWPNDILIGERKICGILTEMVFEPDRIQSAVVGFGVNVGADSFPDDLSGIAVSLRQLGINISQKSLIRCILEELRPLIESAVRGAEPFEPVAREGLDYARAHSATIGSAVTIRTLHGSEDAGEPVEAIAVDISDSGELVVRLADGRLELVRSGEVQIRKRRSDASHL